MWTKQEHVLELKVENLDFQEQISYYHKVQS